MDIFKLLAQSEKAVEKQKEEELAELEFEEAKKEANKNLDLFEVINSIRDKKYILNDDNLSSYQKLIYMINRGMSMDTDTLVHAYIMSTSGANLPPDMHYEYLYKSIRKGKSYTKWAKAPKYDDLELIMNIYQVSQEKAINIRKRLTDEQIEQLQDHWDSRTGGIVK